MNLYHFLSEPKAQSTYRMCAMDFHSGMDEPIIREPLDTNRLKEVIREQASSNSEKALQGRILVIEDLSREIVEILGTVLHIDPLFFALHLHTVQRTSSHYQTPDEATLPSRLLTQDYANVAYHRVVISETEAPISSKFLRKTTINRKLIFLRPTSIALAQHCASIIRIKDRTGPWLGRLLEFLDVLFVDVLLF
jgi:hypothetical protein